MKSGSRNAILQRGNHSNKSYICLFMFRHTACRTNEYDKEMLQSDMSRGMGFPTMWYVRPAEPQISLRIRTV